MSEPAHNPRVVAEGLGLLTSMYAQQPNVKNVLKAVLSERQKLEDVLYAVYSGRNLRTAALYAPPSTNAVLDAIGALIGQPREGLSDARYRPVLFLRTAVNRATGRTIDWSKFAQILLGFSGGPVEYYDGVASFFFFVGAITTDPAIVAKVLVDAVPNGIGPGVFAYTTWPDGGDFAWGSVADAAAGQGPWGSVYDSTVGGLLVASFWLGHLGSGATPIPIPIDEDDMGIYGDGRDGTAICDGVAAVAGMSLAGGVYTLTRDVVFASLTVNVGIKVVGAGWRVFALALINNGTLHNSGSAGTAGAAGPGGLGNTTGYGTALEGGAAGGFGTPGGGTYYSLGLAGAGGAAGGGGASGGGLNYSILAYNTLHVLPEALRLMVWGNGTLQQAGGGAGGGGGDGGGGGGSGNFVVAAATLTGSGAIEARGGKGADAIGSAGSGGGGGGALTLATRDASGWSGTTSVAGGLGGTGVGPLAGVAGAPGSLLRFQP